VSAIPAQGGPEIRVVLPAHLRSLAKLSGEVVVVAGDEPTIRSVLDALERAHPALRGTIRDQESGKRRPFVRYYACSEDLSHEPVSTPLPPEVLAGKEPFLVVGAMAGG